MKAEIEFVMSQVHSAWRFHWHAVICAWVLCLLGWLAIWMLPDQYEVRTQVYVHTASVLKPLLQGIAVSPSTELQARVVRRAITSRPTLEKVATATGLLTGVTNADQREKILLKLSEEIRVNGDAQSSVYTISYLDSKPQRAYGVVKHLLDAFVSGSTIADRVDTESAERFFGQQVEEYENRLSESERRLAEFKKNNIGLLPGEQGDYYRQYQEEAARFDKLKTDLSVAYRKTNELLAQLAGRTDSGAPPPMPTPEEIQEATSLDARLESSKRQLDELLLKYTDRHPDVIALRDTIERLMERRSSIAGGVRATTSSLGVSGENKVDSILQELQASLNSENVEVAALEARRGESQRRLNELKQMLSSGPEIEAELARLNRDYGVTKARYEALLQRRESARMSGEADASADVKFQVVEPPRVPVRPVAPRRSIFQSLVLIAAVCAGAALAFLLSQGKPIYVRSAELQRDTGLPVLGALSSIESADSKSGERSSRLRFAVAAGGLVVAYFVVALTAHSGSLALRRMLGVGVS